ncbi:MAG: glutamine-hydrolyzing GMP synthase [Ignavibacteriales bacterium]|nr:glutamine-hydrolyzing GMP synthase [Ignavibacteriales bacterium]
MEKILILDFGSQYTQLIARRVRELGVYSELVPFDISIEKIKAINPKGIILSGGPSSVYEKDSPQPDRQIFELNIPVLGICYGLQIIAHHLGGKVDTQLRKEYGAAELIVNDSSDLFNGIENGKTKVWMSHGDALTKIPDSFEIIARSENAPICSIRNVQKKIYGVQFHPEVVHTTEGTKIISNFLYKICGCGGGWNAGYFIDHKINEIKEIVGDQNVICALSGGVDSSVLAVLLHKAIGDQLFCIHVNNGLMRKNESEKVVELYRNKFHLNLDYVNASDLFLKKLYGISDPERKRKIIGETFIEVFEKEAKKIGKVGFLAQGTLYPDVIESVSFKGPSHIIKTHHNVGGLPEKMNLKLIEPFRELFKDEVRETGKMLGIPEEFIERHPFPGPGLAVRIIGELTEDKLNLLREAEDIFIDEIRKNGLYKNIWQAFAVLLPVQSVGVMGDQRTYENVIALRAVTSIDGMTADWAVIPHEILAGISNRIVNEVRGINRVVYDISSKPPSTIEWE